MAEEQARPTEGASVVMEIGGTIGAVVVHTPGELEGDEIEVWPRDATGPLTHAAVRCRRIGQDRRFAAVFPELRAGEYTLRSMRERGAAPRRVNVRGGQVTEATW